MQPGWLGRGAGMVCALIAVNLVRCDGGSEGPDGKNGCKAPFPQAAAIFYDEDSGASDEALERLWDKLCVADSSPALAPAITSPADGAVLPAETPFEFTWDTGIAGLLPAQPQPDGSLAAGTGIGFSIGLPIAHAHMPPVTGVVHLIEMRPAVGDSLWAFVKREREDRKAWLPVPAFWEKMKGLEGPIELHVTSAHLRENVVDEGPFTSATPVVITIESL